MVKERNDILINWCRRPLIMALRKYLDSSVSIKHPVKTTSAYNILTTCWHKMAFLLGEDMYPFLVNSKLPAMQYMVGKDMMQKCQFQIFFSRDQIYIQMDHFHSESDWPCQYIVHIASLLNLLFCFVFFKQIT